MIIDLSLTNDTLYAGCAIEVVAGRANLTTPIAEAINIIGANLAAMVAAETDRDTVTLTGPMAVWAYLIAFHVVVHAFREVRYHDGRGDPVVISRHG